MLDQEFHRLLFLVLRLGHKPHKIKFVWQQHSISLQQHTNIYPSRLINAKILQPSQLFSE